MGVICHKLATFSDKSKYQIFEVIQPFQIEGRPKFFKGIMTLCSVPLEVTCHPLAGTGYSRFMYVRFNMHKLKTGTGWAKIRARAFDYSCR